MSSHTVYTSDELLSTLEKAQAGDTILLGSGNYGSLSLYDGKQPFVKFTGEVTIKSADPSNPAVFERVKLSGVENLTLDGVKFDYDAAPGAALFDQPFLVQGSKAVTIRNSTFDGDVAEGVSAIADGYGTGYGLNVRQSAQVTVENNVFHDWMRAGVFGDVDGLVVAGNEVHSVRSDGFNFSNVDNVTIEGNHLHDFRAAPGSADHPDMIQFWTNGTTSPSTNIVIRDNFLNSGAGTWTQSIFMRNDMVDRGLAGPEMFYQNVTIENNVIHNAHAHGITVGETNGLVIQNNTLLQNAASAADARLMWVPTINLNAASTGVTVADNIVPRAMGFTPSAGWIVQNNLTVQASNPDGANYVGDLFVNALAGTGASLADLQGVSAGLVQKMGVGASLTDLSATQTPVAEMPGQYLLGTTGNDVLVGGAGSDKLEGDGGHDTLNGGVGADTMMGGAGNDTYYVDDAGDLVFEVVGQGTDTVYASVNYTLQAGQEVEVLRANAGTTGLVLTGNELTNHIIGGAGADTLTTGGGNDQLEGGAGNDILNGGAGTDVLNGGAGDDRMMGGAGNDIYFVDNAGDLVLETAASDGFDSVKSEISYTLGNNVERLYLTGTEAINATGNSLANILIGNQAANVLIGGAGADKMDGGGGADVFRFTAEADSTDKVRDLISNFTVEDQIDLSLLDANTARAGNDTFSLATSLLGAQESAGSLYLAPASGGERLAYLNTDSDSTFEMVIRIQGTITTADFNL